MKELLITSTSHLGLSTFRRYKVNTDLSSNDYVANTSIREMLDKLNYSDKYTVTTASLVDLANRKPNYFDGEGLLLEIGLKHKEKSETSLVKILIEER